MRLRGEITIDFDVSDYIEAASHQAFLTEVVQQLRDRYPDVAFNVREKRARRAAPDQVAPAHLMPAKMHA